MLFKNVFLTATALFLQINSFGQFIGFSRGWLNMYVIVINSGKTMADEKYNDAKQMVKYCYMQCNFFHQNRVILSLHFNTPAAKNPYECFDIISIGGEAEWTGTSA